MGVNVAKNYRRSTLKVPELVQFKHLWRFISAMIHFMEVHQGFSAVAIGFFWFVHKLLYPNTIVLTVFIFIENISYL